MAARKNPRIIPSNRVAELRGMLGVTQAEFARRADLTPHGLQAIEECRFQPNLGTARRIALAFGSKVDHVFPVEKEASAA